MQSKFAQFFLLVLLILFLCMAMVSATSEFIYYDNPKSAKAPSYNSMSAYSTLSGSDPVFGTRWHGPWVIDTVILNLKEHTIHANLFQGKGGQATLEGVINPNTFAISATIKGTETYIWSGGAFKNTAFTATYEGSLGSYWQELLKNEKEGDLTLTWQGPLSVQFTAFEYESGGVMGGESRAEGGPGQRFTSDKAMLKIKGAITKDVVSQPVKGISLVSSSGEVEYSRDGGTFKPLTKDMILKPGDYVSTGFGANAVLDLGFGKVTIPTMTQLRIDDYVLDPTKLQKTQLNLYTGTIKAKIKHTPSIRSDFSVTTPTSIASIRGSEMQVDYDRENNVTTISAIENNAYVSNGGKEVIVSKGMKVSVSHTIENPVPFKKKDSSSQVFFYSMLSLLIIGLIIFAYIKRK